MSDTPLCPETKNCSALQGVCVLLSTVKTHLLRRDWLNPTLTDNVLSPDTEIDFYDAVDQHKNNEAHPIIAYSIGGIDITPTKWGAMSGSNIYSLDTQVSFLVSSVSKVITKELAFELGVVLGAMRLDLQDSRCFIKTIHIDPVQKDKSNNFYISSVTVGLSCGYPIWKTRELEDILREVKLVINPVQG